MKKVATARQMGFATPLVAQRYTRPLFRNQITRCVDCPAPKDAFLRTQEGHRCGPTARALCEAIPEPVVPVVRQGTLTFGDEDVAQ
jgi:hypothetical protein